MTDEREDQTWLRQLASVARQQRDEDVYGPYDALAAGTLTDAQARKLRSAAQGDEELVRVYEAFRPLGEVFQNRMVQLAEERLVAADHHHRPQVSVLEVQARGWWSRKLRKNNALPFLGVAALAAGLMLAVLHPSQPGDKAMLPSYSVTVQGGAQIMRGTGSAEGGSLHRRRVSPGEVITVLFRPAHAVQGRLETAAFLERGGTWQTMAVPVQVDASGSVLFRLEIGHDLQLKPGRASLCFVVGRPGKLPTIQTLLDRATQRSGDSGESTVVHRVGLDVGDEVLTPP